MLDESFGDNQNHEMEEIDKNNNGCSRPETQIENSGLGGVTNFGPSIHLNHQKGLNYQYSATSL
jgi:hypothetical protein